MLDLSEIKGKHICVATPCYGGMVFQNYYMSIIKFIFACQSAGVHVSFIIRGGDSLIPRTRNSIVAEFLATEGYTHLFWIDADVGFEPEAALRLLQSGREVACGVYPMKTMGWPETIPANMTKNEFTAHYAQFPFNPVNGVVQIDADGFVEVLDAPTGLMMIEREALLKMVEAYPDLKIASDVMPGLEGIAEKIEAYTYRFFDVMTETNGRYLSEDYGFCRRWQAIGGKIVVDALSDLTHQGTYVYTGNLLEALKARMRPVE